MTTLLKVLAHLLPRSESQREQDERYLGGAVDMIDFERRQREVDRRGRGPASIGFLDGLSGR